MKKSALYLYNSLSRKKEEFVPILPNRVGMYVCGPTVYSDVHLGNCRTFISFDVIYRYLIHLGYKVRYVRNITDVGHLENEEEATGEDKIAKKARLEQLEPMEIVQKYTNGFHDVMRIFNTIPPSIEPSATGHIVEQIEMVQQILDRGYAYVKNGSVYFKTVEFAEKHKEYGQLSGKILNDLYEDTRDLKNQSEKEHSADFAIWMKAAPEHIMHWNSPWSVGFPGWHLECSVMSTKYLGDKFDIHGGGMDLKFPHHENEVAQNIGACGHAPSNYWLHTNMLTFEGTKMSKSLGNSILPGELFTGEHKLLEQAYSPMTVRFFMLQTHYRSTLDFSNDALKAGEKGYRRLMEGLKALANLEYIGKETTTAEDTRLKAAMAKVEEQLSLFHQVFSATEKEKEREVYVENKAKVGENLKTFHVDVNKLLGTVNKIIKDFTATNGEKYIKKQLNKRTIEALIRLITSKAIGNVLGQIPVWAVANSGNEAKKFESIYSRLGTKYEGIATAFAELDGWSNPDSYRDETEDDAINNSIDKMYEEMSDDFNTPKAIATIFTLVKKINQLKDGILPIKSLSKATLSFLQKTLPAFVNEVLGLKPEEGGDDNLVDGLMQILIGMRQQAREDKDWGTSDKIRNELTALEIQLLDGKDGTAWKKG